MRSSLLLFLILFHGVTVFAQSDNSVHPEETYESFHKRILRDLKKGGGNVVVDKNIFPPQGEYMQETFKAESGPEGYTMVVTYWSSDGAPIAYFNYGSESVKDEYFKAHNIGNFGAMILKMGNAPGRTGYIYLKKSGSCPRETCMVHLMVVEY
jgi:hypothetical protein